MEAGVLMRLPSSRARDGFTIVEVILAVVLLSFVVMGFQAATGTIIHHAARSDRQAVAMQLAEDRLDWIRMDTRYGSLRALYEEEETAVDEYPGLVRTTTVVRTLRTLETGVLDYHTITVRVDGPGLRSPVTRTIVVAPE
jgi:type II secretory pathway pseudopilin PulG